MDDLKTVITSAVNALTTAIDAELRNPVLNGKTIAAMGIAVGTLRAVGGYLDVLTTSTGAVHTAPPAVGEIVDLPDANWETLAAAVTGRRHWLSMSQGDVTGAGGPSEQTLGRIENGRRSRYTPAVLTRLERALRWPPGVCHRILTGEITSTDDLITAPWAARKGKEKTAS